MSKIHKVRPFCNHCRYSKLHAEKVPITKEQIRQTFEHKNLDFFRPLQVWQNMSKIHKFRPFPTTVGMIYHIQKNYTREMNKILEHLYIKV